MLRGRILVGHSLHNDLKVRCPHAACAVGALGLACVGSTREQRQTHRVLPVSPEPRRPFHVELSLCSEPGPNAGPCPCSSTFHADTARPPPLQPPPVAVHRAPARSGPFCWEAVRAAIASTSAAGTPLTSSAAAVDIAGGRRAGRVHSWGPRGCGLRPLILEGLSR